MDLDETAFAEDLYMLRNGRSADLELLRNGIQSQRLQRQEA